MCDQRVVMPGGDSGLHGEEPALPSATANGGEVERELSGKRNGRETSERLGGEESGVSGGEVAQEDEEMASGSHDLSSSTNHSPGSASGSTSVSAKRYSTPMCSHHLAFSGRFPWCLSDPSFCKNPQQYVRAFYLLLLLHCLACGSAKWSTAHCDNSQGFNFLAAFQEFWHRRKQARDSQNKLERCFLPADPEVLHLCYDIFMV